MGLFSSSSKTYVSTVSYPLGNEDLEDRVDYTKYLVLNSLLQRTDIAGTLTRGYMTGGGMKFRAAYRYARDKYTQGLPSSGMLYCASPDRDVVIGILESRMDGQAYLNTAFLGIADFTFWAERYLAETYGYDRLSGLFTRPPDGVDANATVTYDIERSGAIRILMMNDDGFATELTYWPKDLASGQLYLHTVYQVVQSFPTETTVETRPSVPEDVPGSSNSTTTVERTNEIQETHTQVTIAVDAGTTTITTAKTVRTMSRPKYFLYRVGAGTYPTVDAWRSNAAIVSSPFYPSVPFRVDNVDVSAESRENTPLYKTSKKLLGFAGVEYEDIAEKLRTNQDIKEIDFAFVQFGVALNTKLPEGKKYVYRFFELIQNLSAVSKAQNDAWEAEQSGVAAAMETEAGDPEEGGTRVPSAGFTSTGYSSPPTNRLQIEDPDFNQKTSALKISLEWQWADTTVHTGTVAAGAKPGDCTVGVSGSVDQIPILGGVVLDKSLIYACRQIDANTYEKITVSGLVLTNHVYKDKTVIITAHDAMTKPDEEGFILPLSHEIFREMGMRDSTQLSFECLHLVLNCYKVVKKKWYQTGLFKILLVIVAVVITVLSMGTATPMASALVSAAATVSVTLGVSGIIAAFIVATVTVLAGMLLTSLLTPVLVDVFGEKWGRVLAIVATALTMNFAMTGSALGSLANAPLNATTIIQGTGAVLNLYGAYNQGAMVELDVDGKMKEMKAEYDTKMEEIERLTREFLSPGTNLIDIDGFIKATAILMEKPGDFLSRTLLTGSDIAAITAGQIENFADVGLMLPNTG